MLILRNDLVVLCDSTASTWLLGQQANVRYYILHFPIRQLTSPRMHGAEDDSVFDGPQQFFVGFQKRRESVKIGRRHLESLRVRSIPPASDTVAGLALALIHGFAASDIDRIFLCLEQRSEQEADEPQAQSGCHASEENTHHTS